MKFFIFAAIFASLAQLVEQLIRNEQVVGSSPIGGSKKNGFITHSFYILSGKRGSNPRPSAWEADALPLSYSRIVTFEIFPAGAKIY
jgi:hypothetical protein